MNTSQLYSWQSVALTHTGNVRQLNEDSFLERSDIGHWAVADGMGGHTAGDVASQRVVEVLADQPVLPDFADFVEQVEGRLMIANRQLIEMAGGADRVIGTTVAGLVIHQAHYLIYWCGDSRVYLYRKGRLVQQTTDHTYTQELVEQGKLRPEEMRTHPENNVITRAVGAAPELFLDMDLRSLQPGDLFLICSDGLDKELDEQEIESYLARGLGDIGSTASALMECALARGGRDNISLILVRIVALGADEDGRQHQS